MMQLHASLTTLDSNIQFLCSTGLLKVGNSRNPNATVVVKAEWDKFINEQGLSSLLEPINQTSISNKRHYFIHFGRREKLAHHPIDQLKGIQRKRIRIVDCQCKFHKQISEMLMILRSEESTPKAQDEESLPS
jgi:hypothetical protein